MVARKPVMEFNKITKTIGKRFFLLYVRATYRNINTKGEIYYASYIKKDVQNLGEAGDIINVKDGYARNFLLPQAVAEVATEGALQNREKNIARIKAKQEKLHQEALEKLKLSRKNSVL